MVEKALGLQSPGATDGIGLEFCKQLARDGFNICLVSRTESKLKALVESDFKGFDVKTRTIIADFGQNANNMAFYEKIMEQVKELDVGLVVLSAGVSHTGIIDESNPADQ